MTSTGKISGARLRAIVIPSLLRWLLTIRFPMTSTRCVLNSSLSERRVGVLRPERSVQRQWSRI
jgi:hypothetical protein